MSIVSSLSPSTLIQGSQNTDTRNASDIAADNAEEQKTDFLELLLTQLANQNPLDPMNSDEFAAQLTRFSQLEQQIQINAQLEGISGIMQQNELASQFTYIGSVVELESNISTPVNGQAAWSYLVEGAASDVKLKVVDENGSLIYEGKGSIENGVQTVAIDVSELGVEDGEKLYLSIEAVDSDKEKLNTQATSYALVDGVVTENGVSYLTSGDIRFKSTEIKKIVG